MPCAQGLSSGKTAGLTCNPRPHVRSHPPRSSQHTAPNFLQLILQTATLLSPTLFGAGWTLSAGSAKRQNSGVSDKPDPDARWSCEQQRLLCLLVTSLLCLDAVAFPSISFAYAITLSELPQGNFLSFAA